MKLSQLFKRNNGSPKVYSGGNGLSTKDSIIINPGDNPFLGVFYEYKFLEKKHGQRNLEWFLVRQSLIHEKNKSFDKMEITLQDGTKKEYFFDITSFFGLY